MRVSSYSRRGLDEQSGVDLLVAVHPVIHRDSFVAHFRTIVILSRLFPLAVSFRRDFARWIFVGTPLDRDRTFHEKRATALVDALASLGPTFVKLAQVFGSRPDVVPEPYLSALGTLTDRVPAVPFEEIEREIVNAYGRTPEEMFETFDAQALASGSLGQVYRARYQGRDVVVKVLRPGVEELVASDIHAVTRILEIVSARWSNSHLRGFRVVVDEFSKRIGEEMDFRQEAANAIAIARRFATNPRVLIPDIETDLTRQRVIVMEYMEGTRVDSLAQLIAEKKLNGHQVVESVVEAYIQMMLVDGLFHADPHPGNLLVTDDGRLVLLDFGMVVRVETEMRRTLIRTAMAAVSRNTTGVIDGFYELGVVEPGTDMSTIHRLVDVLLGMAFDGLASADIATRILSDRTLADDVMRTIYDWPIILRGELVYFGRAVALIEGIGARYVPGFNPVSFAAPVILRHRRAVLAAMGDDAGSRADLGVLLGRLAGDIANVVVSAGREVFTSVVRVLPSLFAPIAGFLDPVLVELTRRTGVEVFPPASPRKLLVATSGADLTTVTALPHR
jgi:predicted unusual protein kinase regulating ubiquinone biosynthesis (AarF/ABC1/UbiB family)